MPSEHEKKIQISIVIPCLNEAETVASCVKSAQACLEVFKQEAFSSEIIISDNGSTDGSQEIARSLSCRVVDCPKRGYGNALRFGILRAKGTYIIMGDSDGSHDFLEAVPMIRKLIEGYDLCMGTRFKGKILPGSMNWKNRYIGNPALTGILNIFFRSGLSDAHCGMRAFTKEAFKQMHLRSAGMEFASEMVVKASLLHLKCTEIPITHHPDRRKRPPHLQPWRDGWRHLKFLFLYSPLWLFLVPSMTLVCSSALIIFVVPFAPLAETFKIGPVQFGDHWMILSSSSFAIGFQGLLLGIISLIYRVRNRIFLSSQIDRIKWLYRIITIENIFLIGVMFILLGLIIFGGVLLHWYQTGFHGLAKQREMTIVATCFVVGMQAFFSGLLFSIIADVRENN